MQGTKWEDEEVEARAEIDEETKDLVVVVVVL